MKLEQSFEIKAPIDTVWNHLIEVDRVAPCLPGAEVTGKGDDGSYEGSFQVKLGPTTAAYRGTLKIEERDDDRHVVTMSANAQEKRGGGSAKATMVSSLSEAGEATRVEVVTDFTLTGRLARFGRGGMIQDVSNRLLRDFSACLQRTLEAEPEGAPAAAPASERPAPEPHAAPPATAAATPAPAPGGPAAPTVEVGTDALEAIRAELAALRREVEGLRRAGTSSPVPASAPINGMSLMLGVLADRVKRLLGRSG